MGYRYPEPPPPPPGYGVERYAKGDWRTTVDKNPLPYLDERPRGSIVPFWMVVFVIAFVLGRLSN